MKRFLLDLKCYLGLDWHFVNKLHLSNLDTIGYQSFLSKLKFEFLSLLWQNLSVSLASFGYIWWVLDHTWKSYSLEQPEWIRSPNRNKKVVHKSSWLALYLIKNQFPTNESFWWTFLIIQGEIISDVQLLRNDVLPRSDSFQIFDDLGSEHQKLLLITVHNVTLQCYCSNIVTSLQLLQYFQYIMSN